MILKGQFTEAVIFSEDIETSALEQIQNIINQSFMEDVKVRIMPDVHAGAGICIGYTATLNEYIVPNFIGVDIGCGISCLPLSKKFEPNFKPLDFFIKNRIPSGFAINQTFDVEETHPVYNGIALNINSSFEEFCNYVEGNYKKFGMDKRRTLPAIGSLGGGNHFISIDKDDKDNYFLVVHSGSRNYGKCVAEYYQKKTVKGDRSESIGYLVGADYYNYLNDMNFAQVYASLNRRVILKRIVGFLKTKFEEEDIIESVHNYIDLENQIIRKGAISAKKGEKIIIPLSMADGVLLCEGKGNEDWNCSAPHGAGRAMSRSTAKQSITVHDFKKRMEEAGVWSSCINKDTLDEAPQAYKNSEIIKNAIGDTAEIIDHWQEVYNFKAM